MNPGRNIKISIITACYNSESTVEFAIKSVLAQSYPNIEYIIIDGGSGDGTLGVLKKYQGKISKFISEKDRGIYDALNKGISMATGDVIGFLHSDDFYANENIISEIAEVFNGKDTESLYGNLQYVNRSNEEKIIRNWISGEYKKKKFLKGWMPPHPTFFVKRSVYERFGSFNLKLKSAADYELMLRFLYKENISTSYLPKVIVKMRLGGTSNKSIINRVKANIEDRLAWKINGLKPGLLTLTLKPLSKIRQYL